MAVFFRMVVTKFKIMICSVIYEVYHLWRLADEKREIFLSELFLKIYRTLDAYYIETSRRSQFKGTVRRELTGVESGTNR